MPSSCRSLFSVPRLMHTLRCIPCAEHPSLTVFDNLLREGINSIINSLLSNIQWLQASLPIRDGGLGIRRATSLALSAFLASAASTSDLQHGILLAYARCGVHWCLCKLVCNVLAPMPCWWCSSKSTCLEYAGSPWNTHRSPIHTFSCQWRSKRLCPSVHAACRSWWRLAIVCRYLRRRKRNFLFISKGLSVNPAFQSDCFQRHLHRCEWHRRLTAPDFIWS